MVLPCVRIRPKFDIGSNCSGLACQISKSSRMEMLFIHRFFFNFFFNTQRFSECNDHMLYWHQVSESHYCMRAYTSRA